MQTVSIVGAGIAGLAHAYAYAKRGCRVTVYERSPRAAGASVRNFGMIWPIGQPSGRMADLAMRSRRIWMDVLDAARLPYMADGSLHLTYAEDEAAVAQEFAAKEPQRAQWIGVPDVMRLSPAARLEGLRGALHSRNEVVVDPRLVLSIVPEYLDEVFGVEFRFNTLITDVRRIPADVIIVCSGHDFSTLYPRVFESSGMTQCKLQMMRTVPQPAGWRLGPALAAGLTLRFYPSFRNCPSLPALERRIETEMPDYNRWGIHVMASQTHDGAITIGDSHEYGLLSETFDKQEIDALILRYLRTFARLPEAEIAERWHGVYAKHPQQPYFTAEPEPGVRVVTGLGGAGMTLSFGLAEELAAS